MRASWSAELVVGHDGHVVEGSPSLANALPDRVVGEPLRGEAVLAAKEGAGGAEALVAAALDAPLPAEVVDGGVGAHPAAAADDAEGDAVLLAQGAPAGFAAEESLTHQDMLQLSPIQSKCNKTSIKYEDIFPIFNRFLVEAHPALKIRISMAHYSPSS